MEQKNKGNIVVSKNIFFESIIFSIFPKLVISQKMMDSYYFGYHLFEMEAEIIYIYIYNIYIYMLITF